MKTAVKTEAKATVKANESAANRFKATRLHHRTEAAEDYCELIRELLDTNKEARICQIAHRLGISHVTAIRTLARLQGEGYIKTSPRRPVVLTRKGKRTASYARARHLLLVNFLVALGVPQGVAEIDIEGAEHHFSNTTLKAIRNFMAKQRS